MPPYPLHLPVEWVAGLIELPEPITAEGVERTHLLLILTLAGKTIAARLNTRDHLLAMARVVLAESIVSPTHGAPPVGPIRLRVADESLAEALCDALPPVVTLVAGPTPEIDAAFERAYATIAARGEPAEHCPPSTFLEWGASHAQLTAWFRAAAALHRAAPWRAIRRPEHLLSVTIESLGVRLCALSMIHDGEGGGFALFLEPDAFYEHLAIMDSPPGEPIDLPPCLALQFSPPATITTEALAQVDTHGWERPDPTATPMLFTMEGAGFLGICARDVAVTEAIALALPQIVAHADAVRAAYDGGPPLEVRVTVDTHAGSRKVELHAPAVDRRLSREVCEELSALDLELENAFASAPEARGIGSMRTVMIVCAVAVSLLQRRFISLAVDEADDLIFDVLPRVLRIEPRAAASVLESLAAYTSYLTRVHAFSAGPGLLRRLGIGARTRLEAAIGAPRTFGWPLLVDLEALMTLGTATPSSDDADRD